MKTTRALTLTATLAMGSLLTGGTAHAAAGHTTCRDLGATTAAEAREHLVAPEIRDFAPGSVDDLIALVQLGGTFGGETVDPLCQPK
ncbi:MAG: hypothetical protein ABR593_10455 [Candidatus Limnocylindria bacterium]